MSYNSLHRPGWLRTPTSTRIQSCSPTPGSSVLFAKLNIYSSACYCYYYLSVWAFRDGISLLARAALRRPVLLLLPPECWKCRCDSVHHTLLLCVSIILTVSTAKVLWRIYLLLKLSVQVSTMQDVLGIKDFCAPIKN